jgi:hypothetical protein
MLPLSLYFMPDFGKKFTDSLKAKEQEEKETRLSKLRPAIRNMLKGNPNVFHYSTFATADKLFSQHPIWQQAKIEAERRLIFEEYVQELKQRDVVRYPCCLKWYRSAVRILNSARGQGSSRSERLQGRSPLQAIGCGRDYTMACCSLSCLGI